MAASVAGMSLRHLYHTNVSSRLTYRLASLTSTLRQQNSRPGALVDALGPPGPPGEPRCGADEISPLHAHPTEVGALQLRQAEVGTLQNNPGRLAESKYPSPLMRCSASMTSARLPVFSASAHAATRRRSRGECDMNPILPTSGCATICLLWSPLALLEENSLLIMRLPVKG